MSGVERGAQTPAAGERPETAQAFGQAGRRPEAAPNGPAISGQAEAKTGPQIMQGLRRAAQSKAVWVLLAALVGAAAFLALYGSTTLDVTDDNWLLGGYDEQDILQSYGGWIAYRASPWAFPLGMAERMGVGSGTIITYTDSIPWAAVLFKLLRSFLPETFQYYGLYTLFCFMLQGVGGYLLLAYLTKNRPYALLGSVLFCFSPILIERSFRHPALGSHWLILFCLLLYFMHRDQPRRFTWPALTLLEVLAIGIHPYFLPMVACISLLCMIEDLRKKRFWAVSALLGQQMLTLAAGWLLGAVGFGKVDAREPYGVFSMNLNAPYNPGSLGGYTWSALLPTQGQTLGNYDGFNYLGLGVLLALPVLLILAVWQLCKKKRAAAWLRRNSWLLLASLGLTIYAVSNVVTFNDRVLFEYPLPAFILGLCSIFRASGRMFYPVYYLVFLGVLVLLWRQRGRVRAAMFQNGRWVYAACAVLCAVQLWDLRGVIAEKHAFMSENAPYESVLYTEPELATVTQKSEHFLWAGPPIPAHIRKYAVWALKNGMDLYDTIANGGDFTRSEAQKQELLDNILLTKDLQGCMIATTSEETCRQYLECRDARAWFCESTIYLIYEV